MLQGQSVKKSRRKKIAIRSFTYGMMTIAVLFGVLICFGWAMGFRFDLNSGKISQVALLQFNSFPSGANVEINNKLLSGKTLTRENYQSGQIDVKIWKNGYRDWTKNLYAAPSSVVWLNYARLVPSQIKTDKIAKFFLGFDAKFSPDRRYLLATNFNQKQPHNLVLWNLSDAKNPKKSEIALDEKKLPNIDNSQKSDEKISIIEWDSGSRYALLVQKNDFLLFDRENPEKIKNISRDFDIAIQEIHFADKGGRAFFARVGDTIRKIDYATNSVSAPLVKNVLSYKIFSDNSFSFVAKEEKKMPCNKEKSGSEKSQSVNKEKDQNSAKKACKTKKIVQNVGIFKDSKTTIIRTFEDLTKTVSDFAEYNGEKYLLVGRNETVMIYSDPLNTKISDHKTAYLSSPGGIELAEFSPTGRFVVAKTKQDSNFVSYDIDTGRNFSFKNSAKKIFWLDDFHLINVAGGEIIWMEFDGGNRENIVRADFENVSLSRDEKFFWSFKIVDGAAVLQRSQIILD